MNIVVIGGGFVGQLIQLAVPSARVLDWRKTAPANHLETRMGPQYLWEPIPGVPSDSFPVTTLVDGNEPTTEAILAYKKKIGKEDDGGDWGLQFRHKTVGWTSNLPMPRVEYGRTVRMVDLGGHMLGMEDWTTISYDILINTIPLPAFLELMIVGPQFREGFKFDPIYMSQEPWMHDEEVEPGMTLNYSSVPDDPCYRRTTVETGHVRMTFNESLSPFPNSKKILPGKIHPNRESELLIATLATYDCFSFGRYATWQPDELAHQTWHDIVMWKSRLRV
jgi:hypothetical protein